MATLPIRRWVIVAVVALGVAGAATPLAVSLQASPAAAVDGSRSGLDDFTFSSYDADFYLGRDAAGRSTLRSIERFTAVFPEFDQNRGMIRAIPMYFDNHPVDVDLVSVTDENGNPRSIETEISDGYLIVTSRENDFVHGANTYVFTTELHNVIRFPEGGDLDEFVWDTNGSDARQPVESLSARVHVDPELEPSLSGDLKCARGFFGDDNPCDIVQADVDGEVVITASTTALSPFENVTLSVGFERGTFVPRDDAYFAGPFGWLQLISTVIAGFGLAGAIATRLGPARDARGYPTVVPQYEPPEGVEPLSAALLMKKGKTAIAAQLLSFAVARMVDIVEGEPRGLFRNKPRFLLRVLDTAAADSPVYASRDRNRDERERLFTQMLGAPLPGQEFDLSEKTGTLATLAGALLRRRNDEAKSRGWKKAVTFRAVLWAIITIVGVAGAVGFGIASGIDARGGLWPMLPVAVAILALLIVLPLVGHSPFTQKGAEVRDHLIGLRDYIQLAEADRIRVLQSPETAERRPAAADDPSARLALYEKLLPYAVVFGLETQWAQEIGHYYEPGQSPSWYSGNSPWTPIAFASGISSLSSSTTATFGSLGSSSGSGGSSFGGGGGGSSGGGGGGGGTGGA